MLNDPTNSPFDPRKLTDAEWEALDTDKLSPADIEALIKYKAYLEAIENLSPERIGAILDYLQAEGIIDLKRDVEGKPEFRDGLPVYVPNEYTDEFARRLLSD